MKPLKKVRGEIRRKEIQLAALQAELKDLRAQEQQLENTEMITAIRNAKFEADDILQLISALKKGGSAPTDLLPSLGLGPDATEPSENMEESLHETV